MLYIALGKMRGKTIYYFVRALVLILVYLYAGYIAVSKTFIYGRNGLGGTGTDNVIPTIYVVTPTHARHEQKADLTRLSYALRLVPKLHWILVEDGENKTSLVLNFLNVSKLAYTHLNVSTPDTQRLKEGEDRNTRSRGTEQRNAGISWIRENVRTPGVVYFADDDNTYDIRIFEEMRYTKKVSVWPVGLVGYMKYESPICTDGKVTGWETVVLTDRQFATDMAGFAVNVQLVHDNPEAQFRAKRGMLEPDFLKQLKVTLTDLEPRASNCTEVLVWHTRTERSSMSNEVLFEQKFKGTISRSREV